MHTISRSVAISGERLKRRADSVRVYLPRWSRPYVQPSRYKCAYGGRGSSKTWTFAHLFVGEAARKPIRVACGRQFQSNIEQSVKQALEVAISRMKLGSYFSVHKFHVSGKNGSLFFFKGLENNPQETIRGWENVDRVWLEEAHLIGEDAHSEIIHTIRKPGAEIWYSWNPKHRTDWVWQRFVVNPRPGDITRRVNYNDNPWFPANLEEERLNDQKNNPNLYSHIWEGEPDDGNADTRVMAYSLLVKCVEAYRKGLHKTADAPVIDAGLDVADAGSNMNALVIRKGPVVMFNERWATTDPGYLTPTARRADRACSDHGTWRLTYDAGGVGAPLRGEFAKLSDSKIDGYALRGVNFGQKVDGPDKVFSRGRTNKDMFSRKNIQMAWALRLRAQNTARLLAGEDVPVEECLFIPPELPQRELFLAELAQPVWRDNPITGKTELDKRNGAESPDWFDATCLAFARDSQHGLRAR